MLKHICITYVRFESRIIKLKITCLAHNFYSVFFFLLHIYLERNSCTIDHNFLKTLPIFLHSASYKIFLYEVKHTLRDISNKVSVLPDYKYCFTVESMKCKYLKKIYCFCLQLID